MKRHVLTKTLASEIESHLVVYARPKSCQTKIERFGEGIKVYVTAVPDSGQANEAIVRELAKFLKIPKSAVSLISGRTHRAKIFLISGLSSDQLRTKIDELVSKSV